MKRIRNAFVTGILILVPLMATIDIIRWLVGSLDRAVRIYLPTQYLPFDFGGLGLLLALGLILIVGAATQSFAGYWLVGMLDQGIKKIAFAGGIYGAIKKFLEMVFNPKDDRFSGVVLVEFPRQGVYSIGFRTGKPDPKLSHPTTGGLVNVFVPCTPNPTSGFYLLVPEKELVSLSLSVQEAFKIVISMGIVTSEDAK